MSIASASIFAREGRRWHREGARDRNRRGGEKERESERGRTWDYYFNGSLIWRKRTKQRRARAAVPKSASDHLRRVDSSSRTQIYIRNISYPISLSRAILWSGRAYTRRNGPLCGRSTRPLLPTRTTLSVQPSRWPSPTYVRTSRAHIRLSAGIYSRIWE